jgi:REase_DpnII-MboI
MHPAIANGLAAELDRLAAAVRQSWVWPSPAAGFTCWLARQRGMPPFVPPPAAVALTADSGRLHEAPVLASHGYLLGADDADPGRIQAWTAAAGRLRGRDPLPGDRASFFFRPVELLGTALGAVAASSSDPEPLSWLREVLRDGRSRLNTDIWSVALNTMAAAVLGDTAGAGRIGAMDETTAVELAALWFLATDAPDAAAHAGLSHDADALESLLLYRITTTTTANTGPAEATVTYAAASSAIRTGLARPGCGRPAALITITGLLRRFPSIVRELGKRHNQRPPLTEITDEYDVQDVLRGVLAGLFDDVREEENTPSHAGLRSRMDLLLKREQIVIETKMTRDNLGQRKVAEELAIDKEFYRSHPDCRTLVCFIYDPGRHLDNPIALETDLTEPTGPMPTVVIVAPLA